MNMAKEWYLMQSPYDQLSGYEDESFQDFGIEGFSEALDSEIAADIQVYNYDLSECTTTKAIIQDNLQETRLKTLNRQVIVPIGIISAGMYVKYKDRFWLIIGLVDDNGIYEQGVMTLCNYLLTWVNRNGEIVQRWANITTASQYNNGETSTQFFFVRTDQLLILTPNDDECLLLHTGIRFIIDHRCRIYEKNMPDGTISDTSNPVIIYRLTRSDSVLYDYQDSGHFEFLATQDEQRDTDGYYVIDGKGYWLCDKAKEESSAVSHILSDSDIIYNGLDGSVFVSRFLDEHGNEVNITPTWTIDSDFDDSLDIDYTSNSICISVNNKNLINKSFILTLSADGYDDVTKTIYIRPFL